MFVLERVIIEESVFDRAFFLLASMQNEYKKGGKCREYCYRNNIDELVELVKKLKPLLFI